MMSVLGKVRNVAVKAVSVIWPLFCFYGVAVLVSLFSREPVRRAVYTDTICTIIFGILYLRQKKAGVSVSDGTYRPPLARLLPVFLMFLGVCIFTQIMGVFIYNTFGDSLFDNRNEAVTETAYIYYVILTLFLAPLVEELMVRGIMLTAISKFSGRVFAAFLSAVIFALMHGTVVHLVPAGLFGFFLGVVYTGIGKLRYTVILHFLYNLIVLLLSYYKIGFPDFLFTAGGFLFLFIATVSFIIISYLLLHKTDFGHIMRDKTK